MSKINDTRKSPIAKRTLLIDRLMNYVIAVGGSLVIAAMVGIFVFIFFQVLPLFQTPQLLFKHSVELPHGDYHVLGVDEWGERPFAINDKHEALFVDVANSGKTTTFQIPFSEGFVAESYSYDPLSQSLIAGSQNGRFALFDVVYEVSFASKKRQLKPLVSKVFEDDLLLGDQAIQEVTFGFVEGELVVVGLHQQTVVAKFYEKSSSLFGEGTWSYLHSQDLSQEISGKPWQISSDANGEKLLVLDDIGGVYFFKREGSQFSLHQYFIPFKDKSQQSISLARFLFGDVSVVFVGADGENRVFSLLRQNQAQELKFGHTKTFEKLEHVATAYAKGLRNKLFVLATDKNLSLRYATTESVRLQQELSFSPKFVQINQKNDSIFLLDTKNHLHVYSYHDPHPESGFSSMFSEIWYEGFSEPKYSWQSTGGSDEFEPKLSLMPLIFGTLKGTAYAMLFSLPIALLAAIYVSQFLHRRYKDLVKSIMEIMASFPSVILGFLAALWLAPILENAVPAFLLMVFLIPAVSFLCGSALDFLERKDLLWIKPGFEFLIFLPVLVLVGCLCWYLGPVIEHKFMAPNFSEWYTSMTGSNFEQRNSLVVGFIMGFAVIPIIFTVAEDALSNVPSSLTSASLALGASRWQTAMKVVLPSASSGIFSAVIVGLGRAVGETMIVVMATGNTPIMEWNIFSGMRTLSANIAVELPEAPHLSTLYRTLFLGALVLFVMTFVLNTIADILRTRLRKKYRTV